MKKVFVQDNVVQDMDPDMPIYPESMMASVPDQAKIGWVLINGVWGPEPLATGPQSP